ncbi:hypothetical protein L226DRAFT_175469 [Lentinus tigrinus ALCF2SS1-7]|uniref:F-box domain-containing protein n=1 Tax=Lentinus tigrinus ALCF2SS1-6 TaxID=1328759 RepID=A0A5C2RZB9_9APHY|nr:hypothetical protein L227DRAFT_258570 [Lentinus tigrinus ALCF2SS1-6]RPD71435.1 hypothetical protein L226DRAFT_175469 [Lentinus tigrinus ALCF2SS1-7]
MESKRRGLYEDVPRSRRRHIFLLFRVVSNRMSRRSHPATLPSMHPSRAHSQTSHATYIPRQPSAYHLSRGRPHPIVRIPNKLLLKILAAANPGPGPGAASWSPYWVRLAAVCRHWRELILDTPQFWQKIAVGRSVQWLELCLRRSQNSPIQMSFRYPVVFDATMKVLQPFWHRVEYLSFKELDCAQFSNYVVLAPMPQLRTLIVKVKHRSHSIRDGRKHDVTGLILSLTNGTLPRLRTLDLEGLSLVGDAMALSSLRVLHLGEYASDRPLFTTAQFVTFLSSCTSLEHLIIEHNALDAVVPSPPDDRTITPVAQLGHGLRDMTVHGSAENIANLLSHVHVPAHVDLALWTRELAEERAAAAAVNMLPAGRLRRNLGILQSATRLKVDSCHEEAGVIKVTATRRPGTSGRLELSVSAPSGTGKDLNRSQARRMYYKGLVRAVPDMFPGAPLDTLVCAGDLDAISECEWRDRLLAHYPTLRTLVIDDDEYGGDAIPIFKALGTTVAQVQLGAITPVCPALEYLWIHNAEPTVKLMEEVRRCLSRRQDHRAAPLRRLRLELNPDYEKPLQDVVGYLPLFKRFVPRCELRVWRRDVDDEEMFLDTGVELPF